MFVMVNMVTGGVRDRVSVHASVWEDIQALRGVAGTRECAQRKAHPVHQCGLSSQELTQHTIKPSATLPGFRTQSVL